MKCVAVENAGCVGRVILVRHGESEGNRDRTFTQNPQVPLTAHGREQAHAAGLRIAQRYRPTRIVASPYLRAWQTAGLIAEVLRLRVEAEADLREQSFGVFAGQPYDALLSDAAYHEGPRWDWRPQGGESLTDVYRRVVPVFEHVAAESSGRDVVVVSHGGVMLALCAFVTGSWDGVTVTPNAGIVVVEHRAGRYSTPLMLAGEVG
jgi:broad specificity phosphatase PhoE